MDVRELYNRLHEIYDTIQVLLQEVDSIIEELKDADNQQNQLYFNFEDKE